MLKTLTATKPFLKYVKTHYCPHCGVKLIRTKKINYKNRFSDQGIQANKAFLHGSFDIKSVETVFECHQCKRGYHLSELRQTQIKQQEQFQS